MKTPKLLFHGGVAGLWVGDTIVPNMAEHRYQEGCEHCRAQKEGRAGRLGIDPETPRDWVYATSDKPYARYYASRAVSGSLYRVRLEEPAELSVEDPPQFPTWRARRAIVVAVLEQRITLTHHDRRQLFVRWGGTPDGYQEMIDQVTGRVRVSHDLSRAS